MKSNVAYIEFESMNLDASMKICIIEYLSYLVSLQTGYTFKLGDNLGLLFLICCYHI